MELKLSSLLAVSAGLVRDGVVNKPARDDCADGVRLVALRRCQRASQTYKEPHTSMTSSIILMAAACAGVDGCSVCVWAPQRLRGSAALQTR
jgi:hypothetical protein